MPGKEERGGRRHAKRPGEPRAAPGRRRLALLYDIGKQLTRIREPDLLIPEVLSTMTAALALRSAVLALRVNGTSKLIAWPSNGEIAVSIDHARAVFAYLLQEPGLASRGVEIVAGRLRRPSSPESAAAPWPANRFLVLPLAVEHRPPFGALQLESVAPLHEVDLSFVDTVVTQLSAALDRSLTAARGVESDRLRTAAEAVVTSAREGETRARAEADLARAVTGSLSEGVIAVAREGTITMMNPAAEQLLGWSERDGRGRDLDEVAPLRGADGAVLPPERRLARLTLRTGGEEHDDECLLVNRAGLAFPVRYTASPIQEDGRISGAVVVFEHLSALRVAEREQRTLAQLGAALVTSLEPAEVIATVCRALVPAFADVCFVDRLFDDGHVERSEVVVADRLGPSLAEEIRAWVPKPEWEAPSARAIRTRTPVLVTALEAVLPGLASMIALPLLAHGRVLGTLSCGLTGPRRYGLADLALAADIAQRVALALDNALLHAQAQAAIAARERVLAVVSHDLRNPLGAIVTGTALLVRSAQAEDWRERCLAMAARIQHTAERMTTLVEQLLDVSRMHAGALRLELGERDVKALVSESVATYEPLAHEKRVVLRTELDPLASHVRCDLERMLQVLGNLLGNAIKFTPSGGSVTLRVEDAPRGVRISVADTGPGIPEEERARIFDAFWQAKPGRGAGAGLGLAIVKGIVDAHHGTIEVRSEVGAGTTFTVTLPKP